MTFIECNRCFGRAFVIDIEGKRRCVVCNPKEFVWNTKTLMYEEKK